MFQIFEIRGKRFEYYSVSKILESESEYSRFEEKNSNPNRIRIYSIISVRKQNINNTPMRGSLCLCPKLLPHPFYHEWASFHAICWKRIKLNLFYLKWLELQAKVNEDFTNTAQRSWPTGSFKNWLSLMSFASVLGLYVYLPHGLTPV